MSYSILLVVEKPDLSIRKNKAKWNKGIGNVEKISKKDTDLKALGANVLLLTLQTSLDPLWGVVNRLGGLGYKYALFDRNLEWTEVKGGR